MGSQGVVARVSLSTFPYALDVTAKVTTCGISSSRCSRRARHDDPGPNISIIGLALVWAVHGVSREATTFVPLF